MFLGLGRRPVIFAADGTYHPCMRPQDSILNKALYLDFKGMHIIKMLTICSLGPQVNVAGNQIIIEEY